MWLKFAQDNIEKQKDFGKARILLQQAIDKYYSTDESLTPQELNSRAYRLFQIRYKIYTSLSEKYRDVYELFSEVRKLEKQMSDEAVIRSGRTIYDPNSPETLLQIIQEKIQHNELNPQDISIIAKDIEELKFGIPTGEYSYGRKQKTPLTEEQKSILNNAKSLLRQARMQEAQIDIPKLDIQYWSILDENTFKKQIDGYKLLSQGEEDENEYPILTFMINKNNGISLYAEVGYTDPDGAQRSLEFQKTELQKFFNEIASAFPNDWNKEIYEIEDEGDIKRILSGELDKPAKLYRMMSLNEFKNWELGEVIPPGKFFATKRINAVGTDFGDEGDREVFTLYGNNADFRGDFGGNLVSITPLKLEGKRLVKTEPS